jgi:hypothetical protein
LASALTRSHWVLSPASTGLARNVTGSAVLTAELAQKRLQLVHDLLPNAALFGVLADPSFPSTPSAIADLQAAARTLGLQLVVVNAKTGGDAQAAPKEAQAFKFSGYQKLIVALLAFLQFSIILDFMIISPLGAIIMPDLNISPQRFGEIVSAYAFSAGVSSLLAAGFADRFDRKRFLLFFGSEMHLFDHLVGADQQPGRKFDPKRLRRIEVDHQLDFCSLLDRQVGWFLAFEDAAGVAADLAM